MRKIMLVVLTMVLSNSAQAFWGSKKKESIFEKRARLSKEVQAMAANYREANMRIWEIEMKNPEIRDMLIERLQAEIHGVSELDQLDRLRSMIAQLKSNPRDVAALYGLNSRYPENIQGIYKSGNRYFWSTGLAPVMASGPDRASVCFVALVLELGIDLEMQFSSDFDEKISNIVVDVYKEYGSLVDVEDCLVLREYRAKNGELQSLQREMSARGL